MNQAWRDLRWEGDGQGGLQGTLSLVKECGFYSEGAGGQGEPLDSLEQMKDLIMYLMSGA